MTIEEALDKVKYNIENNYWSPLPKDISKLVREHYRVNCKFSLDGSNKLICNKAGTKIAVGFNRVVIGDYGAYLEITSGQLCHENIQNKWNRKPNRPVKYIWMETKDELRTKIYFQQVTVKYADYVVGRYYVNPDEVV